MKCSTYCTASSYDMQSLVQVLIQSGMEPQYFDDIIYAKKEFYGAEKIIHVFYFPFGCISIWGAEDADESSFMDELKNISVDITKDKFKDHINYRYDFSKDKSFFDEELDEVILSDDTTFTKLTISYALAQSVKLSMLEEYVENLMESTTPIRHELSKTGRMSMSKTEISQKIGALFNARYSISMHHEILDTPEFFWRRPSYEPLYIATVDFQDIAVRQNILNKRLDLIHELYMLLSNELNHMHSTRIEVVIVLLIALEVVMGIMHTDFGKIIASYFY